MRIHVAILFLALVLSANPLLAAGDPALKSDAWTGVDSLELFPAPEHVHVNVPARLTSTKGSKVTLVLTMPFGCFKTKVQVQHRDDFTHVLTPVLTPGDQSCVPMARYDVQEVSLGTLVPGEHEILVSNVAEVPEPIKFNVLPGDDLAIH